MNTPVRDRPDSDGSRPQPAVGPDGRPAAVGTDRSDWVVPVAVVLGVALVALLVMVAWFGVQAVGGVSEEIGRGNAVDAAEESATELTTFDAATAKDDMQRFLDTTTPEFASSFTADQDGFVKDLLDKRVKMTGAVSNAGVVEYDGDTAHVFVTVRAQVTQAQSPQPQARDYRMDLTMVNVHLGSWKLDRIEFVA